MKIKVEYTNSELSLNLTERKDFEEQCELAIIQFYKYVNDPTLYENKTFRITLNKKITDGNESDSMRAFFENDNYRVMGIITIKKWRWLRDEPLDGDER